MPCLYFNENMQSATTLKRKRSGDSLNDLSQAASFIPPRKVVRVVGYVAKKQNQSSQNPQQTLQLIAQEKGFTLECQSYQHEQHTFQSVPKDLEAWNFEVLAAVRNGDVELLRRYHQMGRNLKCSNQFGETLMHLACRKTLIPVVEFMIHEVGMPLNIHDDTGRTPLHDAFWTPEPSEELIDLMVSQCPEMLLVNDKRGHSPLQYSRQAHWDTWNKYLQARKNSLDFKAMSVQKQ